MENRDKDKMSQRNSSTQAGDINRGVSQDQSKTDSSAELGKKIGESEKTLNEPSSRTGGSVGSSGMESGSKSGISSDSSDLGSSSSGVSGSKGSKDSKESSDIDSSGGNTWGDSGKGSQGGSRH